MLTRPSRQYFASSKNYFDDLEQVKSTIETVSVGQRSSSIEQESSTLPNQIPAFKEIHQQIKKSVENNEPELAVDRLHSWVVAFIRNKCEKHGLVTHKKPLHSLMGEYVNQIKSAGYIKTEMAEEIFSQSISMLEAFNKVRNHHSSAHANPLLTKPEAQLIVEHVSSIVRFIHKIEGDE